MNNRGGGDSESLDQMWDALLTAGRRVYGVAVDDAHHFKKFGPAFSNPGRGWVMVKASALEAGKIAEALRSGDFYSSTGVELESMDVSRSGLDLRIKRSGDFKYVTYFVGPRGVVLDRNTTLNPSYRFQGNRDLRSGARRIVERRSRLDAAGLAVDDRIHIEEIQGYNTCD